jgi:proline dehydrogenase
MKKLGEPVRQINTNLLEMIKSEMKEFLETNKIMDIKEIIDFSNTQIAFERKSNAQLNKTAWLFRLMNQPWMVNIASKLGITAVKAGLPFAETAIKKTIFEQFCGGTTLLNSQQAIDSLYEYNVLSILDYGVEAKETEEDFNTTMNEIIRGLEFSANNPSVSAVSCKVSGMARFTLLEKVSQGEPLSVNEAEEFRNVRKRMESICHVAHKHNVALFVDAEESWIQAAIDGLVEDMMLLYNKEKAIVYGTYQMYRKDRLSYLVNSFSKASMSGYILGAKLVRGAYMDKERKRAEWLGYESPIQEDKTSTDKDFNKAVQFCLNNYEQLAFCNASHNRESCELQVKIIAEKGIPRDHPHVSFCQLLGMSDHLTFNLAKAGFNVAKYMVYGPVKEVLPYLIRRAEENTSVTGDMSREYSLVASEVKRRAKK